MPSARHKRFSMVPGAEGRRRADCQIQPVDSLPPDRLSVSRQQAHDPFHCNESREAARAHHALGSTGQGSSWIVEMITTTTTRKGKLGVTPHLILTSLRTLQKRCCAKSGSAGALRMSGTGPEMPSWAKMLTPTLIGLGHRFPGVNYVGARQSNCPHAARQRQLSS